MYNEGTIGRDTILNGGTARQKALLKHTYGSVVNFSSSDSIQEQVLNRTEHLYLLIIIVSCVYMLGLAGLSIVYRKR